MRRVLVLWLVAIGAVAGAAWQTAPAALADNGPHGQQTALTDSCAGCHRAHTAQGSSLLTQQVPGLCLNCHDGTGSGATTNVQDGLLVAGRGLKAGGFTNSTMDTDWDGLAASRPSTSSHTYDGTTSTTLWGFGALGTAGAGTTNFKLSCVSCHNPHGGAGPNGTATYRILRTDPLNPAVTTGTVVTDTATKAYEVTSVQNKYMGELSFFGYAAQYQLSQWCTQCHTRYDANRFNGASSPGSNSSGDSIFKYRHMVRFDSQESCLVCHPSFGNGSGPDAHNVLQLPDTDWGPFAMEVTCQSCHVSHGSSAQMGANSGAVAWPDTATAPNGNHRSSLLRMDNRGTCVGCHGKQLGY